MMTEHPRRDFRKRLDSRVSPQLKYIRKRRENADFRLDENMRREQAREKRDKANKSKGHFL
jgi:hypothetical protein